MSQTNDKSSKAASSAKEEQAITFGGISIRNIVTLGCVSVSAVYLYSMHQTLQAIAVNLSPVKSENSTAIVEAPKLPVVASSAVPSSSFDLAKKQSFGFFDDITDKNWKHLAKILAESKDHQNPQNPLEHIDGTGSWESYFAWYQCNYEPNFSCRHERRVGHNPNGDGPKWVCDPHQIIRMSNESKAKEPEKPGCIVYSIGSAGDFNFELGMQETVGVGVCEYHIFDMGNFAHKMPSELQNAHYHQWGLKKQGESEVDKQQKYYGLKDTIKKLGHENLDAIDVFKIDCEGCELTSFQDWLDPDVPRLTQILVEVHKPPRDKALKFFDELHAGGYVRFHKEPNIQYPGGGAIEYAFLKLSKDFFPKSM